MFTNKRNLITLNMWQRGVLKQYPNFYIPVERKGKTKIKTKPGNPISPNVSFYF